ncbi:DNA ligase 6 isoform X2 [Telopea speciosissima]|uniref:DNA ligase 6 isoform X2 n=1 Tax=Telopea speciosissima TaxID=54955 RepID=UPI001CC6AB5B|nr:DNA ligase 6 isoform X2 [Telopea speciosissima]
MKNPDSMATKTLALNSSNLFLDSYRAFSQHSPQTSHPSSFTLLSQGSSLPPVPADFPQSKIIPRTRFIVDGFRHSGDYSVSYFLSHFHSDHYTGLNSSWSRGVIFCSETTARLLVESLKVSNSFVVSLSLGETVLIDGCTVTLIDANHCPGAVQFLFRIPGLQGKDERYVHTGDFRFSNSMKQEPLLSGYTGADAIFLDTTYCNPKFVFPSQDDSVDYIVRAIERIRLENKGLVKSVLFLIATYVLGKERILVEIARRCNCVIHVDSRKMAVLCVLGFGESGIFTEDDSATDVHVVGWNILGETWPYFRPNFAKIKEIMTEKGYLKAVGFVPTGWMYEAKRDGFAVRTKDSFEIHLVPYSEHSSYDELREYARFLRPKCVIPTVGSEIEKLDSKHVIEMRKHFAGLVDETANKQDFLMSFHWRSRTRDEGGEIGISINSERGLDKDDEVKSTGKPLEGLDNTDSRFGLDSSSSLQEPSSRDLNVASDKDTEEMIQELRDCLPVWITRDQMLALLGGSGGNIVDAVSEFYERETEFREQVIAFSGSAATQASSTSIPEIESNGVTALGSKKSTLSSASNSEVFSELESNKGTPCGNKASTLVQEKKSPHMKHSIKNTISPKKRAMGSLNKSNKKPNKKAKGGSTMESSSSRSKQTTITKFFNKLGTDASQVARICSAAAEQCPTSTNLLPIDAIESYKEEVDQFLQLVNGSVSRSNATSFLEKAKGDVNLALDIYYCGSSGDLRAGTHSVQTQHCVSTPSAGKEAESSEETKNTPSLFMQGLSTGDSTASFVSLPLEKYSPVEHACWNSGQSAPYLHLARTFNLVEGERGKIKAIGILCNMFRSLLALSPEDVLPAIYLCTNKIAADYENMELNIGGSLVTAALEEACGTNRSKIKEMYNKMGDLGDVAQVCRQTQSFLAPPCPLSIRDVFSSLQKISAEIGSGSTTRKKMLIVNLMHSCREKEIKFLVRTLVRNLRIGAMMRSVLPALAQAVVMNSNDVLHEGALETLKPKLQSISAAVVEAYNILPNLDLLVPSLMNKGADFSSTTLSMVPGIPIRPMLARITNGVPQVLKMFQGRAFTCEYKYDGQRAQIHRLTDGSVRVFSRNGDETTSRFPDLVNIIKESCKPDAVTFILDAEVVAVDRRNGCKLMSFQELSSRERGSKDSLIMVDSIKVEVSVFVFDIMFANGEQLLGVSLRQRRRYLKDLFHDQKLGYFEYAMEIIVEEEDACVSSQTTLTRINSFLEDAISSSCEGIMVKCLDVEAGYAASKRTDTWLKVKRDYVEGLNDSIDLVPIGAWHGNGRKAGWYSPFLMACYNPETEEFQSVCRVMSGFSDSFYVEMKEFFSDDKILSKKPPYYQTAEVPDIWFSPELVWEIRGADFTISPVHQAAIGLVHPSRGISIRFPRFIRSVLDRRVDECSTAEDIADMFRSQTRKMDVEVA